MAKGGIKAIRIAQGTNIFRLPVAGIDTARLSATLATKGIDITAPAADSPTMNVLVNESWARRSASELATEFLRAMGKA